MKVNLVVRSIINTAIGLKIKLLILFMLKLKDFTSNFTGSVRFILYVLNQTN